MIELEPRKKPTQPRARATVTAILDAAARVLVEEGYDRASTNRIAEVAGVSVGSLYQYFPGKEAVILAVFRRHSEGMVELLRESVGGDLAGAPIPEAVRTFVRALMKAHSADPALERALIQQVLHLGLEHVRDLSEQSTSLVRVWLELRKDEVLPDDLDTAAYVLEATVEALVHAEILYPGRAPDAQRLEDEIVALVVRYLTGG